MGRVAAIFDLDRTLLLGSSSPAFAEAYHDAGLSSRRSLPGQGVLLRGYELFGENLPSMALARLSALASRDRAVADAHHAAVLAAERLEERIGGHVRPLLELHRAAGRTLVLATTTPADLVGPLAERLGFDDVVATRYRTRVDPDGVPRYTGGLDGPFVWSVNKLRAVRTWARAHDVTLRDSWAYSDSIYDLPLLGAVGHPTAVNPDARLLAAAVLRRWPVLHVDVPAGVPKVLGMEPLDMARLLLRPSSFPYARFDIAGTEHIPASGPVIVAANHRSYFDVVAWGLAVFAAGRKPRGMAKRELFDAPVVGQLLRATGAIRVDRGDAAGRAGALGEAEAALRAGELVLVAPQGTIPRGTAFFEPRLRGRRGVARLAAATGAPVIPLGVWGTEAVWPRSARLPNVTALSAPPTVRVRVGPAVAGLTGRDLAADTQRVMEAIVELLPAEARLPRIPSADELARTEPPA